MAVIELNRELKEVEPLPFESPGGFGSGNNRIVTATGSMDDDSPCCSFYTCFACRDGRCTVLNSNDFHGGTCPFYMNQTEMKKGQQDAFDRLLISGRLDLINRYEEVLVTLGIEDPEDAKVPIDDDILAARKEMEDFKDELVSAEAARATEAEADDFLWDE